MSNVGKADPRIMPVLIRDFNVTERWIKDELISLWHSLLNAHRFTNGNYGIARRDRPWSMECEGLADRIKSATELVGPADWHDCIGMPSIIDGWFVWANEKIGIENAHLPTPDDVIECSRLWDQHSMGWK